MRLRELRKKNNLTQAQVAEAMGVSAWTVSMWEKGPRKPEFDKLERLADLLHVQMGYLLGVSDDDTPPQDPSDKDLAEWGEEDHIEEMADYISQFIRMDYRSQQVVMATISSAFRLARAADELKPEDYYKFSLRLNRERTDGYCQSFNFFCMEGAKYEICTPVYFP